MKALQLGAFDFLLKPVSVVEVIQSSLRNALDHQRLRTERDELHREVERRNMQLSQQLEELEEAHRVLRCHVASVASATESLPAATSK